MLLALVKKLAHHEMLHPDWKRMSRDEIYKKVRFHLAIARVDNTSASTLVGNLFTFH